MLLSDRFLRNVFRDGTLALIGPDGTTHTYGDGNTPRVTIRVHDRRFFRRLPFSPSLAAGEAYMDGTLTIEDGDVFNFLDLATRNLRRDRNARLHRAWEAIRRPLRRLQQFNPVPRAEANVRHHYDLSGALYDLFLDRDRQYSCAYFPTGAEDLDTAQELKKRHIAAKLLLRPGQRVLDVGSGWGGLALHLAGGHGVQVEGVTLSREQLGVARERAAKAGLADRAEFHLRDYRLQTGRFDRIVSVGMFEHVGINHFRHYFGKIAELLADRGIALLHTIGRAGGPGVTDPWIRRYIFPGGYIPALSEILPAIERAGLIVTDVEVLRLHYAETIRHWRERFDANRERARALYDERFCRMWEFYLAGAELSFRNQDSVVFQIQMAKRQDAVPLARDYITDADRAAPGRPAQTLRAV